MASWQKAAEEADAGQAAQYSHQHLLYRPLKNEIPTAGLAHTNIPALQHSKNLFLYGRQVRAQRIQREEAVIIRKATSALVPASR
jgi:hypothetical protein